MEKRYKQKLCQLEYANVCCILFHFLYILMFQHYNTLFLLEQTASPVASQILEIANDSARNFFLYENYPELYFFLANTPQQEVFLSLNNSRAEYYISWYHPYSLKTIGIIQIIWC